MEADVKELTVNGKTYVLKGSESRDFSGDVRIVVLQRGWVLVGHYSTKGDYGYLDGASVIRKWGTDKGLGQLVDGPVESGPYAPTVLDKCHGRVEFLLSTTILMLNCDEYGWKKVCK